MAIPIVIPKEGQSMETAKIVKWIVARGDQVNVGDIICEVESDKAAFDIEAPVQGYILEMLFDAGSDVPVLTPVAFIGKKDEIYEEQDKETISVKEKIYEEKIKETISIGDKHIENEKNTGISIEENNMLSPRAKKLAKDNNISIAQLTQNISLEGPITENIVRKHMNESKETGEGHGRTNKVAIDGLRKIISDKMLSSLQTTAQFTLNFYADATQLLAIHKKLKVSPFHSGHVSINDIMLFVTVRTLCDFKELNGHYENGANTHFEHINIGFAVDVPNGLMVPVIKSAERMSLMQISEEARSLASACRQSNIKSDRMKEGTFTVTNLGSFGVEFFTPILNAPEIGILGIGQISPRPIRRDGVIEFIDHIALSVTVNHQIVDGALAARFLNKMNEYLTNLDLLLAQ